MAPDSTTIPPLPAESLPPIIEDLADLAGLSSGLASEFSGRVVLADVRWYLDGRDGHAAFMEAHLPGAVWIDLDHDLAAHDLPAAEGRHPLPTPAHFAAALGSRGIADGDVVVAYDDTGGLTAGRLVVMLRMIGRPATLLSGGLRAWTGPLESGPGVPRPAVRRTAREWPVDRLATADVVSAEAGTQPLLDARAHERFTGQLTAIDPRPGHIPGACNAPWNAVLDAAGRVLPADALRAHYQALGVGPQSRPIAYCGSGVSACLNVLALERAALPPARLFVASWSGWSADPDRPAALGE